MESRTIEWILGLPSNLMRPCLRKLSGKKAQQVKVLAKKPAVWTHSWDPYGVGRKPTLQIVLWPPHPGHWHMPTHRHTHNKLVGSKPLEQLGLWMLGNYILLISYSLCGQTEKLKWVKCPGFRTCLTCLLSSALCLACFRILDYFWQLSEKVEKLFPDKMPHDNDFPASQPTLMKSWIWSKLIKAPDHPLRRLYYTTPTIYRWPCT